MVITKTIPQRLKPEVFCAVYGTAKAVPVQSWILPAVVLLTRILVFSSGASYR
jgi:hypothetical protein